MKNLLLIFLISAFSLQAVKAQPDDGKEMKRIEALKIAFISQKLDLSPEEAQKFWPVYGNYENEMKQVISNKQDEAIDKDEKVLNVRKKYREEFIKVIGQPRMNKLFNIEREFRGVLIRHIQNKNNRQQRPMLKRGN